MYLVIVFIMVMNIILISDVFGKTPAVIKLAKELNAKIIVDPYNGKAMGFKVKIRRIII